MYNGLKYFVVFSLGAAAGIAVSWKILEEKYKKISQEEIDSVKEWYSNKKNDEQVVTIEPDQEPEYEKDDDNRTSTGYYPIRSSDEYHTLTKKYNNEQKGGSKTMASIKPYVIPPEDFGELDGYETISLTYYADGVLADDMDERITNVDDIIGSESLKHFGEYEDDSVFVRNDELLTDYEILFDTRDYEDVVQLYRTDEVTPRVDEE